MSLKTNLAVQFLSFFACVVFCLGIFSSCSDDEDAGYITTTLDFDDIMGGPRPDIYNLFLDPHSDIYTFSTPQDAGWDNVVNIEISKAGGDVEIAQNPEAYGVTSHHFGSQRFEIPYPEWFFPVYAYNTQDYKQNKKVYLAFPEEESSHLVSEVERLDSPFATFYPAKGAVKIHVKPAKEERTFKVGYREDSEEELTYQNYVYYSSSVYINIHQK